MRLHPVPFPVQLPDLVAAPAVDPDAGLIHVESSSDRTWWLGGRRVHAEFHGVRGLTAAHFGASLRAGPLAWGSAAAATTWITPRAARFERASPAGSFLESIWLPERLPGVLVELRPVGSWLSGRAVEARLEVSIDGDTGDAPAVGDGELGLAGDGSAWWLQAPDGDGLLIAAFDEDGPVDALLEPGASGTSVATDLRWVPGRGDSSLSLAILAGEASAASLRSLMVARAHARRADPAKEALRTRTGVDEVDDGVAWAWTRIRDRTIDGVGPVPALDPADTAVWVRTALAVGLPDAAPAVQPDDPSAPSPGSGMPDESEPEDAEPDPRAPDASTAGPPSPGDAWRARIAADPAALEPEGWRILAELIDGVLRWRPDVETGRMHLTPSLPDHWTRFVLEGLRGGELRMRLEWARETSASGGVVETWRFAPMAGAVPATLILRLPLPDAASSVTVDGVPAELDVERGAGPADRPRSPIQLQLDRERVVRVGGPSGGNGDGRRRMALPTVSPPSG